jgi:DNA-binding ferritin-like protein
VKVIKSGKKNKMTKEMMQEILDDWKSWRHDIYESNKSTWNTRDDSKVDMIGRILEEKLEWLKK